MRHGAHRGLTPRRLVASPDVAVRPRRPVLSAPGRILALAAAAADGPEVAAPGVPLTLGRVVRYYPSHGAELD
jgi:hypothetical protein